MNIGDNIKIARKNIGINQQSLGDLVGLSRATIVNIEKNRHNINSDKIQLFCKALNTSPNFIIYGKNNLLNKDEIFKEECFEQMYYKLEKEFNSLKLNIREIIKTVSQ